MAKVLLLDFELMGGLLDVVAVVLVVRESLQRGADSVLLAHFEVLAEVLVTAPPGHVDHPDLLVASHLVEI